MWCGSLWVLVGTWVSVGIRDDGQVSLASFRHCQVVALKVVNDHVIIALLSRKLPSLAEPAASALDPQQTTDVYSGSTVTLTSGGKFALAVQNYKFTI